MVTVPTEIASALAFRDAALAVMPKHSSKALPRELEGADGSAAAFAVAIDGHSRTIDCASSMAGCSSTSLVSGSTLASWRTRFSAHGLVRSGFYWLYGNHRP